MAELFTAKSLQEEWRSIMGFPHYSISSFGRIRSNKNGKIKKSSRDAKNYSYFKIYIGKKVRKRISVHRAVATAFLPNPRNKKTVNHIDGNALNNNVENLELNTQQENIFHSRKITKNGSVISSKKIKRLADRHPEFTKSEFIELLLKNCT